MNRRPQVIEASIFFVFATSMLALQLIGGPSRVATIIMVLGTISAGIFVFCAATGWGDDLEKRFSRRSIFAVLVLVLISLLCIAIFMPDNAPTTIQP
jgi:hypothetical protein